MSSATESFCARLKDGYASSQAGIEAGLLLAISGGADSVALLHATRVIWPQSNNRIVVAHVDHSLRKDSQVDADFVNELAVRSDLPCEILKIAEGQLTEQCEGSIEEAARKARYELLTATAHRHKLNCVVTAHHMDDQAETVLHNIVRGTGLRGLRGMQRARQLGGNVRLIRPMLDLRRSEIVNFLTETDLAFRTDSSNDELIFTRNRVRRQLLPSLKKDFNEAADRNLVSLARQAEQTIEVLDALAERILCDTILEQQPDVCRLDREKLRNWPDEIIRHVLSVLWIRQDWPRQKMAFRHYSRLATAITADAESRDELPGGISAQIEKSIVRLNAKPE